MAAAMAAASMAVGMEAVATCRRPGRTAMEAATAAVKPGGEGGGDGGGGDGRGGDGGAAVVVRAVRAPWEAVGGGDGRSGRRRPRRRRPVTPGGLAVRVVVVVAARRDGGGRCRWRHFMATAAATGGAASAAAGGDGGGDGTPLVGMAVATAAQLAPSKAEARADGRRCWRRSEAWAASQADPVASADSVPVREEATTVGSSTVCHCCSLASRPSDPPRAG